MTENQLGKILKGMYSDAPKGYQAANVHLFGVKYAPIIFEKNLNVRDIVSASKLPQSYVTEVCKGIKLSKYVIPR